MDIENRKERIVSIGRKAVLWFRKEQVSNMKRWPTGSSSTLRLREEKLRKLSFRQNKEITGNT